MRIAKQGYPFIVGSAAAGLVALLLAKSLGNVALGMLSGVLFLLAAFCAYFFRDPSRIIPRGDHLILSPADGKVMEIVEGKDPAFDQPVWIMRIFLSVFDPHIQRMPVGGKVEAMTYTKGKFLDARDPKACFENEQNRVEINSPRGRIVVTQIAGLIARRIVWWVREGQSLAAGEQFGLIRFGSQVDVVLPKTVQFRVKAGDRVEAGSSVIAEAAR